MIPDNITITHVLQAIADFDMHGIRFHQARSKKYFLEYNNQHYPPKYIVCLANEFVNGRYLSYLKLNTSEAQRYLAGLSGEFLIKKIMDTK